MVYPEFLDTQKLQAVKSTIAGAIKEDDKEHWMPKQESSHDSHVYTLAA